MTDHDDPGCAGGCAAREESVQAELLRRNRELTELNEQLSRAQAQLLQSEKLASIGQLAAGVAHEINNPISFVFSNFGTLDAYVAALLKVLGAYQEAEPYIADTERKARIAQLRAQIELDYLVADVPVLMSESREGIERVRKIVQDLKDFSRVDGHQDWQWVDLHQGIDSTLNIVNNEIKYKADVVKAYGQVPEVECLPSQINQVILNIVVNGAQAIAGARGCITIRTGSDSDHAWIEIADNGSGIPAAIQSRIFDPFFTTKPIGSGTGLGLSLSYGIIQKHQGRIDVQSEPGIGTTFRIVLPIRQQHAGSAGPEAA
jgi:two-component system NtrC family sensor kinase